MSLAAITCSSCGGSVAMSAGARLPACLFCGAEKLIVDASEAIQPPELYLPFDRDEGAAREAFRAWSRKRFWAPTEIRSAALDLHALLLPAWSWSGRVEVHWAGLVRASTQSGKRPTSGVDTMAIEGMLVPSSQTLRQAELNALSPFEPGAGAPFEPESAELPYELGSLTERASRAAAHAEMERRAGARIADSQGTTRLSTSSLVSELDGRPLLLPIWIGAYRVGDAPYRVVINGQTGALAGEAPISWVKVAVAVGAGLALLSCVAMFLAIIGALS